MRVVMLAHAFPPTLGGVETHLWDVTRALVARGHEVTCLVGGDAAREVHAGVVVVRTPDLGVPGLRRRADAEARYARLVDLIGTTVATNGADVVHLHNAHHFAAEPARAAFAAAAGAALVNTVHDKLGDDVVPAVLELPWDLTVYVSEHMRAALPVAHPSCVLPLGIDLAAFAPVGPRDPRLTGLPRPVVFHPARLLRWKGIEVGVRAFAAVRRAVGGGTLVLCASESIADDPADVAAFRGELVQLAASCGVEAALHFADFPRSRIAAAYRAADLVWYPTTDEEPLGLVPIEAMAAEVPLVVSDSGGMRETVLPGVTALTVPRGDVDALAAAAIRLLTDADLRRRLVAAGRLRARRFGLADYVRALEAQYAALTGERTDAHAPV